jgi:predicted AlkP superfamily phosphohydrolase/phosphomutase
MLSLFPDAVQRKVRRARQERRDHGLPVGYRDLDWQPACWYADRWPAMRAFALPSFYDGRVRVNLRGREANGTVAPADYERVLDEIEALARECVDPITGASVVESVERPAGDDPFALDRSLSDLVIVWAGCPLAFHHPRHGEIGPVPYRRTGGHTGPYGFASITGPDVAPGEHGIGASLDVAPTVYELLEGRPPEHLSGTSRVRALTLAG